MVLPDELQDNGDEGHSRLDEAELECRLLAKPQESDGVGLPRQTAGAVHAR